MTLVVFSSFGGFDPGLTLDAFRSWMSASVAWIAAVTFDDAQISMICTVSALISGVTLLLRLRRKAIDRAGEFRWSEVGSLFRGNDHPYRLLFESNPVPMWVVELTSLRFLSVNDAAIRQYGYTKKEFLQMTVQQIQAGSDFGEFAASARVCAADRQKTKLMQQHLRKDGSTLEAEVTCDALSFGRVGVLLIAAYDVTDRLQAEKALRESQERYRATFEDAVVGIFQSTKERGLVSVNRALARMIGYSSPEQMLRSVHDPATQLLAEPKKLQEMLRALDAECLLRGYEAQVVCKNGSRRWVAINLRGTRDEYGEVSFLEGMVEDITGRKAAESRIHFLAYHDPLTGLPNRVLVQDRIQQALTRARERNGKIAVLLLDLDGFKTLNDSLGHTFGDLVLMKVAERLASCSGPRDTAARIGGDEFVVLLTDVEDHDEIANKAQLIIETIRQEFAIRGQSMRLSCSMGVSVFPEHGSDMEKLIQHADSAMYSAKGQRRNSYCFFSGEMHEQAVERLVLEKNLQLALERNEFFLLFQPQMNIATGKITGAEALLRWNQPEMGLVLPGDFIQAAENSTLILQIGEWVLRAACLQAREWLDARILSGPMAVNVSVLQFRQKDFTALVRRVLDETGLPPEYLEFEITEGLLLVNSVETLLAMRELKAMGLKIAIDDFGTGYCSLSNLKELPVSKLKIDRSFIRGVAIDPDDAAITTAIIQMAHNLDLDVIAEGVENDAQLSFLRENNCDSIQGFYFSTPLNRAEFERVVRPPANAAAMNTEGSPVCAEIPLSAK
jgi:diguanylate cyclase (GGDEF)-like protein/PAS domain S-box-containing protein